MFAHMSFIKDILFGAEKRHADLRAMCEELGVNPADIYQSDIHVSFEVAYKAWDVAVKATGDSQLGLHIGEHTNASILGLVGYLMQSCPNLLEAYKSVCNFSSVASDMFTYSLTNDGNTTLLTYSACEPWQKASPQSSRHGTEQAMAATLNVFHSLCGKKLHPQKVLLTYSRPKNSTEYDRVFNCPIQWKAPANALVFLQTDLLTPVVSYDESMMGIFCELIKQRFEKLKSESFVNQVKREIMTTFKGQLPSIDSMAARLNMTVRSLQRKLADENVSYRQVCHELGKDFAATLLSNREVKVAEVAAALGYSDAQAFQKAFKVWTGKTPGQFRQG
ncbi:MAG: AraC family transcriptional regulator [Bacteroidota bacterium]